MKKTKKILSTILSICILFSITTGLDFSAYALSSSDSCGENVTYTFDSSTGELIISGTGDMNDYYDNEDGYVNAPFRHYTIKTVVINSGVTSIGRNAFYDCRGLTSITIPDSVTSIGDSAFCGCTGLTSVTIPDSVTSIGDATFIFCTGLTSITIPDSVTSIGDSAFRDCTGLTSVTIPDSVTSIGSLAFYNTALYNDASNWENGFFYIGNNLISANSSVSGSYVVKNGTKIIADEAFYYCKGLTSITIPDSVTSIGDSTFESCTSLTSVKIPNSVTSIGDSTFESCTGLTSVTIPNSVTSIGSRAFFNCTGLTSVTIPDSVTSIGEGAFIGCTSLDKIVIENPECEIYNDSNTLDKQATIYGYSNSTAHQYANAYARGFVSLGCYIHNFMRIPVLPTHTSKGYSIYMCKDCNNVYYDDYVNPLPHNYVEKAVIAPTCKNQGYTIYECAECGVSYIGDYVEPTGTPIYYVYESLSATCLDDGYNVYFCEDCNDYQYVEIIDATGHDFELYNYSKSDLNFKCDNCETEEQESISSVLNGFDNSVVNEQQENVKDGYKYDIVDDDIINAKDFARLKYISSYGY